MVCLDGQDLGLCQIQILFKWNSINKTSNDLLIIMIV